MRIEKSVLILVPWLVLAPSSSAQDRPGTDPSGILEDSLAQTKRAAKLETCGRPRLVETREAPIDPARAADLGELVTIDALTGQKILTHITDYLPAGWGEVADFSELVDSFGNPIVNQPPGLPGWSEADVAALRAAIAEALAPAAGETAAGRAQRQRTLGNYLGQALARGIDVGDLVRLDGPAVTPAVAAAVIDELSFAESVKALHAEDDGYEYRPSVYSDEVDAFLEAHGSSLAEVLASAARPRSPVKATPSGCYTTTTFARGMTLLSGATTIWNAVATDNASLDVPIDFHFSFYGCSSPIPHAELPNNDNSRVLVSTNGYATFYQQGGGTLAGTDSTNDSISSTTDPDGYVAPYWDDLLVQPPNVLNPGDKVSFRTEGAVGSRVFTVEWLSITHAGGDPTKGRDFQVKLFEASSNVEFHYGTLDVDAGIESATVGLESFAGGSGDCGPSCANTVTGSTIAFNYRFSAVRPSNDVCGLSTAICLGDDAPTYAGNSFGATGSASCKTNDLHDVWFWYHAPRPRTVTIDTCTGTSFDTTLSVFDACGGTEVIPCNDDLCGLQSSVEVLMAGGKDYYVRLAGFDGVQGTYRVTTGATQIGLTPRDTCATAGATTGSLSSTTADNSGCVDESSCGGAFDTVDEWFSWTAPLSGVARFSTCHPTTTFDTTLAVFSSCGGSEIACNDDTGIKTCSTLDASVVQGQTYYIRVAGFGHSYGSYRLTADAGLIFADGFESGNLSAWN